MLHLYWRFFLMSKVLKMWQAQSFCCLYKDCLRISCSFPWTEISQVGSMVCLRSTDVKNHLFELSCHCLSHEQVFVYTPDAISYFFTCATVFALHIMTALVEQPEFHHFFVKVLKVVHTGVFLCCSVGLRWGSIPPTLRHELLTASASHQEHHSTQFDSSGFCQSLI